MAKNEKKVVGLKKILTRPHHIRKFILMTLKNHGELHKAKIKSLIEEEQQQEISKGGLAHHLEVLKEDNFVEIRELVTEKHCPSYVKITNLGRTMLNLELALDDVVNYIAKKNKVNINPTKGAITEYMMRKKYNDFIIMQVIMALDYDKLVGYVLLNRS